jgi:type IIS restriction enzyme R protein (MBOIIR)
MGKEDALSYRYTLQQLHDDIVLGVHSDTTAFIFEAIQRLDYRGIHLSQHNRYTKNDIAVILKALRDTLLNNNLSMLPIRTTDISKRPLNNPDEIHYARMVIELSNRLDRITQDSLRKNFYVDMARMGLINRFDKHRQLNNPFLTSRTKFVNISDFGLQFLTEYERDPQNMFEVNRLWTLALNNLHNGFETQFYSLMLNLQEYGINSIGYNEFAFFASKANILPQEQICLLIREFKNLSVFQRNIIIDRIKRYADPSENLIFNNLPKTDLRDYHNWINEAQQLFSLLRDSVLFNVGDFKDNELNLRIGNLGLIDNYERRLNRSQAQKREYFIQHNILESSIRRLGFELHHIIPLLYARSHEEFKTLDVWENMILIDGHSHAKITQNGSRNIKLEFRDYDMLFKDFGFPQHIVECIYDQNVKYNVSLKDILSSTNQSLLHYL